MTEVDERTIRASLRRVEEMLPGFDLMRRHRQVEMLAAEQSDPVFARWLVETADPGRIRRRLEQIRWKLEDAGDRAGAESDVRRLKRKLDHIGTALGRRLAVRSAERLEMRDKQRIKHKKRASTVDPETTAEAVAREDIERVKVYEAAIQRGLKTGDAEREAAIACKVSTKTIGGHANAWIGHAATSKGLWTSV